MACEDPTTQRCVVMRPHDDENFALVQMLEREIFVFCPFDVTHVGTNDSTEDRTPGRPHQRHGENSADGETRYRRQRNRDTTNQSDRRADGCSGPHVAEEFSIGVAFEHHVLPSSHRHSQVLAPPTG